MAATKMRSDSLSGAQIRLEFPAVHVAHMVRLVDTLASDGFNLHEQFRLLLLVHLRLFVEVRAVDT